MKKLALLLIIAFVVSCGDEDMYVKPNGDDIQTAAVISEESSSSDEVFLVVEENASFPGGMNAYNKYLLKNLNYPKEAKDKGIEGNVFISFIVDKDGSLSDFEVVRGPGGGLAEEALRVYMESPNWTPGKQRGKAVKTRMQARVSFRLDEHNAASISNEGQEEVEELVFETDGNN